MKILFLSHTASLYGANKCMLNSIYYFSQKGYDVSLIIPRSGPIEQVLNEKKIKYFKILIFPLVYTNSLNMIFQLHNYLAKFLVSMVNIIKLMWLIKNQKIDLIYSNSIIVWQGVLIAKLFGKKNILHIREVFENYNFKYPFHKYFVDYLLKNSYCNLINSKALKELYAQDYKCESAHVVYECLSYSNKTVTPKKRIDKTNFKVCIIGQLSKEKGQHIAINAVSKLVNIDSSVKLFIVGDGNDNYTKQLKQQVTSLNIEKNVIFTGRVNNPVDYFRQSDCSVACSEFEAFGLVVIESLKYGTPVICNNSGAFPEIINHNKNGFLYENTADSLFEYIEMIYSQKVNYNYLSNQAILTIEKKFSLENYVKQMDNVFYKNNLI